MMQQDGPSPNPEAEAYLRRLARESADQVLKGYQAFLLSDIAPELKRAVVEEVRPLIPSRDGLVKEAVDALNAKADTVFGDIRTRIGLIEDMLKKLPSGPAPVAQGASTAQRSATVLQGEFNVPGTGNNVNLGQIGSVIDYALDKFLKVQELRMLQDPIALALKIKAADPLRSAIVGQILNPDPTGAYLGQVLAKVSTDVYGKGFGTGLQVGKAQQDGGKSWPQESKPATPSDGSPAWYGGPSRDPSSPPTSPQPQSAAAPQGSATMTNSGSEDKPRASAQDTVRVSERPGSRLNRPVGLKGNYR